MKFYFVWTLSDANLTLAGFGFNGWSDKRRAVARWDRQTNGWPLQIETSPSTSHLMVVWNCKTGLFLRKCAPPHAHATPPGRRGNDVILTPPHPSYRPRGRICHQQHCEVDVHCSTITGLNSGARRVQMCMRSSRLAGRGPASGRSCSQTLSAPSGTCAPSPPASLPSGCQHGHGVPARLLSFLRRSLCLQREPVFVSRTIALHRTARMETSCCFEDDHMMTVRGQCRGWRRRMRRSFAPVLSSRKPPAVRPFPVMLPSSCHALSVTKMGFELKKTHKLGTLAVT